MSKPNGQQHKLWTIKEAVEYFGISDSTLRRMIRAEKIQVTRIGVGRGMIRIPHDEIERLASPDR